MQASHYDVILKIIDRRYHPGVYTQLN